MPRAANGIADDEAGDQRGAVMCTHRAYGDAGAAAPGHENRLRLSPGMVLRMPPSRSLARETPRAKSGPVSFFFPAIVRSPRLFASGQVDDLEDHLRRPHPS